MKVTDSTQSILLDEGKNATWILVIISALVMFIPLLLILQVMKKYENKNLIEISYELTGSFFGFLIGITLFITSFIDISITSRDYVNILASLYYEKTPILFLYIFFMGIVYYISKRGLEVIGRSCWFTNFTLQLIVLILILGVWKELNFSYMYPILGPGVDKLVKGGILYSSIYGDVIVFMVFANHIRSIEKLRRGTIFAYIGATIYFVGISIVLTALFGYNTLKVMNYPWQIMTRAASFGRAASNIDALFLVFWIMASMLRFSIYVYTCAAFLGYTLRRNNFEFLILPIIIGVILVGRLPGNSMDGIIIIRRTFLRGIWIVAMSISFLLWVLSLRKGAYNK